KLGRAVQLAEESGHTETAKLLGKVVDVVDAKQGTVRRKQKVEGVDAELASVRSVKPVRVDGLLRRVRRPHRRAAGLPAGTGGDVRTGDARVGGSGRCGVGGAVPG